MAVKLAKAIGDVDDELGREGAEGEEDLDAVDVDIIHETVVAASDWTTQTILSQLDQGNIDINPAFQRRDAWRPARKSRFIESLVLGLPIPQLVLAENKKKKGTFIVIDGKQRLLSLRQFAATPGDGYDELRLTGLEQRKDLSGRTFAELKASKRFAEDLAALQNQTIRTVVVKNWPNESVLYLIFLRLNTSSVPLSPQELRQALHPGPFLSFVDEKSGEIEGFKKILRLTRPDFRMRDAELMVRYYAFVNFLPDYNGNLKSFLDSTCKRLNKRWEDEQDAIEAQVDDLEAAIETTFQIFTERNAFRKWDAEQEDYERRFNRAVFDVMVFYFSREPVRKRIRGNEGKLENDFKKLCEQNSSFIRSIETTTKSLEATVSRLSIWGNILSKRLKLDIEVPSLEENRIIIG